MKTTKKALSVLLAVIMIMTSMSVCFGSISFAADDTALVNAFVSAVQCDAMKNFPTLTKVETNNGKSGENKIIYKTFTYETNDYAYYEQVVNVITKLDAAIKGLDEYKNGHAHNNNSNCQDGWGKTTATDKCTDLGWIERHLKLAIGDATLATLNGTYHLDRLFAAVFNMDGTTDKRNADNDIDMNDKTSKIEASIHNILYVKATKASSKLTSYASIDAIPDNLAAEYKYQLNMTRKNYTTKGGFLNLQTINHYHFALSSSEDAGKIFVPAATGTTISTNKKALTDAKTALNSYSNYINAADVNAVLAISRDGETLTAAYDAILAQKNNVINAHNQAVFNKFFSEVDPALKKIADAIEFLAFDEIVTAINTLYGTDFSRMNKDETLAHLSAFRAKWAEFTKLEQATQDLIVATYGLDVDAIETKIQEISDRYDALCIAEERVRINTHIDMYNDWTIDDVDNGNVTTQQLATAIATLYTDMQFLSKYNQELVAAVCGATYMSDLTALYNHNVYLAEGSKMNDSYLAKWQAFINEVQPATADSLEPAELLEGLKNYDAWTVELKTLIADMKNFLGEENANKLYDEVNAVMTDYMDAAYTALNATVETQINTAYDLFTAFKATYGKEINFTSISAYNYMKTSIGRIDVDAYEFLKVAQSIRISQDAINKYNALQEEFPDYQTFLDTFGFSEYAQSTMPDITRPASDDDVAREGAYTTKDADIEKIITKIDALLNNAEVQKLLGQLLNKNEDGTWNGKSFDLGAMLTDLIKGALFTDNMINAVVGMLYPLVVTEFIKVWANDLPADNAGYPINYKKNLYNVFTDSGFNVYPDLLAKSLKSVDSTKYADIITALNAATNNFKNANGNQYYTLKLIEEWKDDGTQKKGADKTPWDEAVLKKNVIDEETGEVVLNDDGTPKTEWALDWGVDAKRKELEAGTITQAQFDDYFYQTFDDAVDGLKPLLLALLGNKEWKPVEVDELGTTKQKVIFEINITIGLQLGATANRGYANLIIPVYEALGITGFKSASDLEKLASNSNPAADILKGILDPIFNFANTTLKNAPLTTILNLLPNLAYALITDMVPELLDMLKTKITYKAVPYALGFDVSAFADISGGADISVGSMLDLKGMGVDLSDGLNTLLPGFGLNIPNIDQGKLATMGKLDKISTGRADFIYTKPSDGKAYHITANKADVLVFLLEYALGSGLLGQFITVPEEEGLVRDLLTNLMDPENTDNVLAALVELLNAKAYNTLENYEWYHGYIDNVEVGTLTDPAVQVYLNPENDWTEEKAQYLYDNIDAIVGAILKMAKLDLDDSTEEVDGSIGKLIGGIFSAKTLTSIARLLGSISDINALIEGSGAETEETETPDASEPETVEEGEDATEGEEDENGATAAPALDIDVNALIKEFLGVDLKTAFGKYAEIPTAEENPDYIYDFGKEIKTASDFAAVLSEMLAPLNPVLGFILDGKNLELVIAKDESGAATQKISLVGYNGYDSAIVPLLEALGCDAKAYEDGKALELTLTALATKIDTLTSGKTIKGIIDILPGLFYFLAGNNLSTVVRNLLQPVYVILDTIRPIYNLDLAELLAGIKINDKPLNLDLDTLNLNFVFELVKKLIPADIDLGTLLDDVKGLIYSVCKIVATEYESVSTLAGQETWKKGAYSDKFDQADLITVLLSYVLEWATDADNAAKLDALLKTNGLIASIVSVLGTDVEITYGDPNWMYWFKDKEAFEAYLADPSRINTLAALDWENIDGEWDYETAAYFAEHIGELVDTVIAMINKDKADAPQTLADLLNGLVYDNLGGYFTAETIDTLIGYISGVLANVDDVLLNVGYELLGINLVALKNYKCEAEIDDLASFVAELARILDSYAKPLVDLLFFGDDIRLAKKSDNTDTIVINGGKGYEKGLAIILEALGCKNLPAVADANATNVLKSLTDRVDEILANPVDEILDLLPNLVYALNADAAGVAVNNLLGPVNALLDKINGLGLLEKEIKINELLTVEINGEKVEILKNLKFANVVEIVEGATGLPLDSAADILDGFCTGTISKGQFGYKMAAAREDVITILLYVALELLSDDAFAAKLGGMIGEDIVNGIKGILEGTTVTYKDINWNYMNGIENDGVIEYVNAITSYPNDWTEEKAKYLAENLPLLVDTVIGMVEINGVKYESLSDLLKANVNIFTTKTLEDLLGLIKGFLGGIDSKLLELGFILDVDLNGLVNYEVKQDIGTVTEFADELAFILSKFAPGVVEWLLLGRDFELLVKDNDGIEEGLEGDAYITISGAHGYAEGLALLLEALGCENLPAVYDVENLDTAATVKAVLNSLAARIEVIFANPVEEVLNILPNLIYFLDADGVDAVISNTTAALMAIIAKLEVFGIKLNINELVDLPELMGIADKYEEGDDKISLDNLTLKALLKAVSLMTGLDLTELEKVLVPFALGEAVIYDSVSSKDAYKMVYKTDLDKHDMISVIVTAALKVVTTEGNAAKLDEMIGTEIISALGEVFAPVAIEYGTPDWDYAAADNGTVDAMKYSITYPNNWNEETAQYVTEVLLSDDFDALIAGLIEGGKYASISELLKDKVNVFTSENLKAIVDLIANLIKDIDDELLDAAGLLLNVDLVGLKSHKIPADINDVKNFAAELSTILSKYAPGVVEWLLLGNDYTFFVESVDENGEPVDFITINGAEGYKKGLAILLEALGCENLPAADGETAAIIEGVLESLANRIDEILSDPIVEVIDLLPNLFYFLNTNGVAVAVKNTTAALTALSAKLEKLGLAINLDVSKMVDLKALLKLSDDAALSMENLSMAAVLEAVGMLVGLDLTHIEEVLVGFALGKFDEEYKSVSGDENAKKMVYADEFDKHDLVTVVANLALITLADDANAEFLKGLVGEDIYAVILSVLNIKEAELKKMSWLFTDKANTGEKFSPMKTSELYKGFEYGPNYTREMAQYIADNFGTFVDNIIKLLGIQINGKFVNSLSELLNNLVGGSVYNSSNVIAIRDALAGILAKIGTLEVEGINVGKYIKAVLNSSLKVNLDAVATVNVPEFTENRDMFVTSLCDVLEPLYPVLEWVLADTDLAFFVDLKKENFVTLPGAEGYKNGIVLLLEALGCTDLTSPEALKVTKGDVMITSILNPLLNRVDEILANPAEEIFAILPNLVYFINSKGVDVVVKNTLNAVYTVLNAIEPIAKIDLYKLIGLDLETLTFEKLLEMLLGNLEIAGFSFKGIPMDAVAELTVGTLETYDSLSAEDPAYRMVYGGIEAEADMVTAILRLLITFATTEGNQKAIVDLLKSIGMTAEGEKYLAAMIEFLATCIADTKLGMDAALYSIYYIYYGVDKGAAEMVKGKDDLSKQWQVKLEELNKNSPNKNAQVGDLLTDIFDIIFETDDEGENGVLDNSGVASQGGLTFFQKIAKFFQEIAEFFRNLFSFGKK